MKKTISVLVPILKQKVLIKKNFNLLKEQNPFFNFELLISERPGIASARNELLYRATGEYLLWLDSDIKLIENPIPVFMEILHRDNNIIGATAYLEWIVYDWVTHYQKLFFNLGYRGYDEREAFERFFDCGLYKNEPLKEVGGFDECFNEGREDLDIAIRLWRKGYKIIWTRSVKVKHYSGTKEHFFKIARYANPMRLITQKYPDFDYKALIKKKGNLISQLFWILKNSGWYALLFPLYYYRRRKAFLQGFKRNKS